MTLEQVVQSELGDEFTAELGEKLAALYESIATSGLFSSLSLGAQASRLPFAQRERTQTLCEGIR